MKNLDKEMKNFSRLVVSLRKQNGLSKKEMAALLHIGVATLTKIENGEFPPRLSVEIVFYIYDPFGIPPRDQFKRMAQGEK